MKNLISMTDFVLEDNGIHEVVKYAKFLKEPLTFGMFVPCDENNEPIIARHYQYFDNEFEHSEYLKKFEQAKERVLFEGFEYNQMGFVYLNEKGCALDEEYMKTNTIEYLVKYNLKLTPTALKQIGL